MLQERARWSNVTERPKERNSRLAFATESIGDHVQRLYHAETSIVVPMDQRNHSTRTNVRARDRIGAAWRVFEVAMSRRSGPREPRTASRVPGK